MFKWAEFFLSLTIFVLVGSMGIDLYLLIMSCKLDNMTGIIVYSFGAGFILMNIVFIGWILHLRQSIHRLQLQIPDPCRWTSRI